MIYILTRTAARPRYFGALRKSIVESSVDCFHVVHKEMGSNDDYIEADLIVEGPPTPRIDKTFSQEIYQQRLLEALKPIAEQRPGWVIFIDDDDIFTDDALGRIQKICTDPDTLYVWQTQRERYRISPVILGAPLDTDEGRICWESAAFHTNHLDEAIPLVNNNHKSNDAEFWFKLSQIIYRTEYHQQIMMKPQTVWKGKGHGRRFDKPRMTIAVPVLGRPHKVEWVIKWFKGPNLELLFLPDVTDRYTIEVLEKMGAWYEFAPSAELYQTPTYASKINHAYKVTDTEFLFYASDDLQPKPQWIYHLFKDLDANPHVGLMALNDGHHLVTRGMLATHGVVRRSYVEEYGSASLPDAGPVMNEMYRHWWCDCEISYVARQRKAFGLSWNSRFFHNRKRRSDETYQLGESFAAADRRIAEQRLPGWPEMTFLKETETQAVVGAM